MLAPGLILRTAEKTEIKMVKAHPRDLQLRLISRFCGIANRK